jgi:hypothetical protein
MGLPSVYGNDSTAEYSGQSKRCYNVDHIGWISRHKGGATGRTPNGLSANGCASSAGRLT